MAAGKMSKSLGNYIGITEPPAEMFGKIMSIPDELMWSYYELVTDRAPADIAALKAEVSSGKKHPMDVKMQLAQEVIAPFHGQDAAGQSRRKLPARFPRSPVTQRSPSEKDRSKRS